MLLKKSFFEILPQAVKTYSSSIASIFSHELITQSRFDTFFLNCFDFSICSIYLYVISKLGFAIPQEIQKSCKYKVCIQKDRT